MSPGSLDGTVAPEHPIWANFAKGMASLVPLTAKMLASLVVSGRVTYHNEENGFCVLRIKARGYRELVTVIEHAAVVPAGECVTASGEWINDRTHGPQYPTISMI
jgi:hypothetical protein